MLKLLQEKYVEVVEHYCAVKESLTDGAKLFDNKGYVKSFNDALEKFASAYPIVKDLHHNGTELENIQQLRLLIGIYNLVVDTVDVTSSYDEEWEPLHNSLNAKAKTEYNLDTIQLDEPTMKRLDELYFAETQRVLPPYREDVERNKDKYLDKKTVRELKKTFAKACRLHAKGKSYFKFVKWLTYHYIPDVNKALEAKSYDAYVSCYLDFKARMNAHDIIHAYYDRIVREAKRESLANTSPNAVATLDKVTFIDNTFPRAYVYICAPLMECLKEVAYTNTFGEFTEVPDALQTTAAVDKILEYFAKKRVKTAKEAVDLYVKETNASLKSDVNVYERKNIAREISEQCDSIRAQKEYRQIVAEYQSKQDQTAAAMQKFVDAKTKAIAKCASPLDYLLKLNK